MYFGIFNNSKKHIHPPPLPRGNFRDNYFPESPMPGEYFGRLIGTGEWGVCLLSSCKVCYPQNKNIPKKSLKVKMLSLDIKYMMYCDVTVQEID